MTPRDVGNIPTTGSSVRDTLRCANMALKLPRYFYLLMEKPLGRYFQIRFSYYQAAQCNQKTYSCILKVTGRVWESQKKGVNITTNHSYHQCSSPYASLNWSQKKKNNDDVMLVNYDATAIFSIYGRFGAIRQADSACMVYNSLLFTFTISSKNWK